MPCTDGGMPYPEERPTKAELKDLLCSFCTFVTARVPEAEWPEHIRLWWEAHQAEDRRRRRDEQRAQKAHRAHLRKLRAEINAELGED